MKKMAVFVEGLTERVLVEKLIMQRGDVHRLQLESQSLFGGKRFTRMVKEKYFVSSPPGPQQEFYILIVDSGTEGRITSDINEQYDSLVKQGHSVIVGVRDVAPSISYADKPKLAGAFAQFVRQDTVTPLLVLATMEVEAWFLAEHTHFERIDGSLTLPAIRTGVGIDLSTDDLEMRPMPSSDLNDIYSLAGLQWDKSRAVIERTVEALDFAEIGGGVRARAPSIDPLISALDDFLRT